jgi:hypothetical protein
MMSGLIALTPAASTLGQRCVMDPDFPICPDCMARRLSEGERVELQARREQLELELRLLTATLRSDEALRVQEQCLRVSGPG